MPDRGKYLKNDPTAIWVAPAGKEKGCGTFEDPFTDVGRAVERARPGYTVVFKEGEYRGDVTVQTSGNIDMPIRIVAETNAKVTVVESCWYFYDVTDIIVSGFTFKSAPFNAVSVIGACQRNMFRQINFINCCGSKRDGCSMYFGGDGGWCNVVQDCCFEIHKAVSDRLSGQRNQTVGLLISEGDCQNPDLFNKDHIFRRNTFVNYGCAICIGSSGMDDRQFGHLVENNIIRNISNDGIRIKCGDTTVKGNFIKDCGESGVSVNAGNSSLIINNRVENCLNGIRVLGAGHTIQNNCIVRCGRQAVHVSAGADESEKTAQNIIVDQNSIIDCGKDYPAEHARRISGMRIDSETSCIIRRNIFYMSALPSDVDEGRGRREASEFECEADKSFFVSENVASSGYCLVPGCVSKDIHFDNAAEGNYENGSDYGAHGWMAAGAEFPCMETPETVSGIDAGYDEVTLEDDYPDGFLEEVDSSEILFRAGFFRDGGGDLPE